MCIETGDGGIRDLKSYPTVQDAVNDGHMTPRAQTLALVAARLWGPCGEYETLAEAMYDAAVIVQRADEMDRHERLQERK